MQKKAIQLLERLSDDCFTIFIYYSYKIVPQIQIF